MSERDGGIKEFSGDPSRRPAVPVRKKRRQSYEFLRFICMFFVVASHVDQPRFFGFTALSIFIILSVRLSGGSLATKPFSEVFRTRVSRILIPWLIWCVIYEAVKVYQFGPSALTFTDPNSLLIGSTIHLWFLVYMVLITPIIYLAVRAPRNAIGFAAVMGVFSLLGLGAVFLEMRASLPEPYSQWALALPPTSYGLLAADFPAVLPLALLAMLVALAMALKGYLIAGYLALSAVVLWLADHIDLPGTWAETLGATTFGIYLSHQLIILLCYKLIPFEAGRWLMTVIAFSSATIFVFAYQRIKPGLKRLLTH
ncbi:acyltransferase [Thalassovita sp.]|uniref:acyltransferase n=1 Tax=Thalassovita sp. TaxID=1979401 RepID=UPI002B26DEB3|nr:acyltransferase [Thalassovita sp.]